MPKNQICETKKKLIFFGDLDFDLQDHPKSKVMMSNESLIMIFLSNIKCNYRILLNTRASPNRRAPKFFDHVPEDSSPKINMTKILK